MYSVVFNFCAIMILLLISYGSTFQSKNKTIQYKYFNCLKIATILRCALSIFKILYSTFVTNTGYLKFIDIMLDLSACTVTFLTMLFFVSFIPRLSIKLRTIKTAFYIIFLVILLSSFLFDINVVTIVYSLCGTFDVLVTIIFWRELSEKQKKILGIILGITFLATFLDVAINLIMVHLGIMVNIKTVGYSYALAVLLMYVTFYTTKYDEITGYPIYEQFSIDINKLLYANKKFVIFLVKVKNETFLRLNIDKNQQKLFYAKLNKLISKFNNIYNLYDVGQNTYAVVFNVQHKDDITLLSDLLNNTLRNSTSEKVRIEYEGLAIPYGFVFNAFEDIDLINNYNNLYIDNDFNILDEKIKEKINKQKVLFKQINSISQDVDKLKFNNDFSSVVTDNVEMYYQPIIENETGKFMSAEALMRLNIPEIGGIQYPDSFIPYIEQKGLIHNFSCIALAQVCRYIRRLEATGKDFEGISVNFSVSEFIQDNFEEDVLSIVNEYNVNPSRIHIELTESVDSTDINLIHEKMDRLKVYGFKFYLDDFGTGYSNLSRLMELPFDVIKFDKSLLDKAILNAEAEKFVKELSLMISGQNTKVLFEGIEDEKCEEFTKTANSSFGQGYKYSKPVPGDKAIIFFENEKVKRESKKALTN